MHHNRNLKTYNMHVVSVIYMTSLWPQLDHLKQCYWLCHTSLYPKENRTMWFLRKYPCNIIYWMLLVKGEIVYHNNYAKQNITSIFVTLSNEGIEGLLYRNTIVNRMLTNSKQISAFLSIEISVISFKCKSYV